MGLVSLIGKGGVVSSSSIYFVFFGTIWKINCKNGTKLQPPRENQRSSSSSIATWLKDHLSRVKCAAPMIGATWVGDAS